MLLWLETLVDEKHETPLLNWWLHSRTSVIDGDDEQSLQVGAF